MKINTKIFKNLTNPVDTYEVDGKVIEVHYMNDTNYLSQYAGQGYFYQWSSDGKSYKLLVEKGYYETLGDLFLPEINLLQIKLYENLFKTRKKLFFVLFLPVVILLLCAVAAANFIEQYKEYLNYTIIGAVVAFILVHILQSSIFKKKMQKLSYDYSRNLETFLGEERFERLAVNQRKYHEDYFKFDDEKVEQESDLEKDLDNQTSEEVKVAPVLASTFEDDDVKEELKTTKKEEKTIKKTSTGEVDLNILGIEMLKDFARSRKIAGFSAMRKSELVAELPKEYEELRAVELQALARVQKIPYFSAMRKDQLIKALKTGEIELPEKTLKEETVQVVAKDGYVDLSILLVEDLKTFAKDRKVSGFSTMRKAELVDVIPNNIHDLRHVELEAFAREHGLPLFSTMRKNELIEALIKGIPVKKVDEDNVVIEEESISVLTEEGTVNFDVLTIEELKDFARERKITGFSTMKKAELIEALPNQIEDLKTNELKSLARVKKVSGFSTMRKAELIEAIK